MKLGLVFPALVSLASLTAAAGCSPATSLRSARTGHLEPPGPVYRFDFTLDAPDGTDRRYSMVLEQGAEGRVHAGSNVPLGASPSSPRIDTGVNVRCKYDLDGTDLLVHAVLSLSSASDGPGSQVHQIEMTGDALVVPGKPALVATIADPSTQSRYQLNVAATRLQ